MARIEGIALQPVDTLNQSIFTVGSMQGKSWNNIDLTDGHGGEVIGKVNLNWSENRYALVFEGEIEDTAKDLVEGNRVSIGVYVHKYKAFIDSEEDRFYEIIEEFTPYELSIVNDPAVPSTRITISENAIKEEIMNKDIDLFAKEEVKTLVLSKINKQIEDSKEEIRIFKIQKIIEEGKENEEVINTLEAEEDLKTLEEKEDKKSVIYNMTEKLDINTENPIKAELEEFKKTYNGNNRVRKTFAITSSGLTNTFFEGIYPVPVAMINDLEPYVLKGRVQGKTAKWTKIPMVEWADLTEGSTPPDATQTISEITKDIKTSLYRQSVTDLAKLSAEGFNLVEELVGLAVRTAPLKIESEIISEVDTTTNIMYGDDSVSADANVTASMKLSPDILATLNKHFQDDGKYTGDIVLLVHPKQFEDLVKNSELKYQANYGQGNTLRGIPIPLRVMNFIIYPSNKISVLSGAGSGGIDLYKSVAFAIGSVGVALDDIAVEIFRDGNALKDVITVSKNLAVKLLDSNKAWELHTA